MSFLSDVLTVGGVQQDDIARLERVLDLHAAALHQGRPPEPGGAMFGGSPAGADLDLQTVRAYEHVREAIDELVAGLHGYRDNIVKFARDLEDTDGGVQGDLSSRTAALEAIESCTTAGDFHNRDVCAPPADGGDA
jgi:hypothetical protein